jgi:hypothetical protein
MLPPSSNPADFYIETLGVDTSKENDVVEESRKIIKVIFTFYIYIL